jgi:hypothetical protein
MSVHCFSGFMLVEQPQDAENQKDIIFIYNVERTCMTESDLLTWGFLILPLMSSLGT